MLRARSAPIVLFLTLFPAIVSTAAVSIDVGSTAGAPGDQVVFMVALNTAGVEVQATQNDIAFNAETPVATKANGRPDCTANPLIEKGGTVFGYLPAGCSGDACTGIRALVYALDNADPIPDGSALYTCKVKIAARARLGEYPLIIGGITLADPSGKEVAGIGTDGAIIVGGVPATATQTPLPTSTPTPRETPCIGTCHGGSTVTVNELLTMVNIVLGNAAVSRCGAGDANGDGRITITEVLSAVNNVLYGCGANPSAGAQPQRAM